MKVRSRSRQPDKKDKQYEGAPPWEETVFREIADNIIDGVYCINTDGYFTFVNRAIIEQSGISPDKFYASHFLDIVHPAYRHIASQNFKRVMNEGNGVPYELRYESADGQERIVEVHSKAISRGEKIIGLLGIERNITERKQAEKTLNASEQNRILVENVSDAILITDTQGYIIAANNKAEELLGYSKEELLLMHYSQFYQSAPEMDRAVAAFTNAMEKNAGCMSYAVMLRKDGETVPVDSTANVIEYGGRKVLLGSFRNISDHKRTKDTLERMVKERTAELDAKNEELSREIKEREQAEERIRMLYRQLIKSQEIERQRISYDLHDNLAQDLLGLKINLDTFFVDQPLTSAENREKISKLSDIVKRTISTIREMAYDLTPRNLKLLGFVPTISQYCKDFSKNYGITVDFFNVGMDNMNMDFDIEITLYRILQECMNNIRKHADATYVTIKLVMSFPNIILRIKDNGKGFDVQKEFAAAANERRMGLRSIDERVTILKGKMRIESHTMQGTEVMIEIPWRNNKGE